MTLTLAQAGRLNQRCGNMAILVLQLHLVINISSNWRQIDCVSVLVIRGISRDFIDLGKLVVNPQVIDGLILPMIYQTSPFIQGFLRQLSVGFALAKLLTFHNSVNRLACSFSNTTW